jgi:hypothetical protein
VRTQDRIDDAALHGGLEGDADRLAELFAERVEAFYREQGWLR